MNHAWTAWRTSRPPAHAARPDAPAEYRLCLRCECEERLVPHKTPSGKLARHWISIPPDGCPIPGRVTWRCTGKPGLLAGPKKVEPDPTGHKQAPAA